MADQKEESRLLTYATLLREGACSDYRGKFEDLYPAGEVMVTVELAVSMATDWDWQWAAEYLLSSGGYTEWERADTARVTEYRRAMAPVFEETDSVREKAREASEATRMMFADPESSEAWQAANEARSAILDPMWAKEREAMVPENLKLQQGRARHFAELYIKEGTQEQ